MVWGMFWIRWSFKFRDLYLYPLMDCIQIIGKSRTDEPSMLLQYDHSECNLFGFFWTPPFRTSRAQNPRSLGIWKGNPCFTAGKPGDVVLLFVEGTAALAGEWVFPLIKHEMFESIKSWIGLYQRTPKEVKGPFIGSCWRFLGLNVLTCWKIELSECDSTRPKKRIFKSERIAKGTITTILKIMCSLLFFVFSL